MASKKNLIINSLMLASFSLAAQGPVVPGGTAFEQLVLRNPRWQEVRREVTGRLEVITEDQIEAAVKRQCAGLYPNKWMQDELISRVIEGVRIEIKKNHDVTMEQHAKPRGLSCRLRGTYVVVWPRNGKVSGLTGLVGDVAEEAYNNGDQFRNDL